MEQRLSDRCSVTWTPAALLLLISQVLALESRSLFRIFLSLQTETPLNHIFLLFWFVTFYYGLTCTLKMIWPGRLPPLRTWVSGYLLSKGFVSGKVPQGKHNVMNWLFYKHLCRLVGLNISKTSHSQRVVSPRTSNICVIHIWELVKNTDSWSTGQSYWIRNSVDRSQQPAFQQDIQGTMIHAAIRKLSIHPSTLKFCLELNKETKKIVFPSKFLLLNTIFQRTPRKFLKIFINIWAL